MASPVERWNGGAVERWSGEKRETVERRLALHRSTVHPFYRYGRIQGI